VLPTIFTDGIGVFPCPIVRSHGNNVYEKNPFGPVRDESRLVRSILGPRLSLTRRYQRRIADIHQGQGHGTVGVEEVDFGRWVLGYFG